MFGDPSGMAPEKHKSDGSGAAPADSWTEAVMQTTATPVHGAVSDSDFAFFAAAESSGGSTKSGSGSMGSGNGSSGLPSLAANDYETVKAKRSSRSLFSKIWNGVTSFFNGVDADFSNDDLDSYGNFAYDKSVFGAILLEGVSPAAGSFHLYLVGNISGNTMNLSAYVTAGTDMEFDLEASCDGKLFVDDNLVSFGQLNHNDVNISYTFPNGESSDPIGVILDGNKGKFVGSTSLTIPYGAKSFRLESKFIYFMQTPEGSVTPYTFNGVGKTLKIQFNL